MDFLGLFHNPLFTEICQFFGKNPSLFDDTGLDYLTILPEICSQVQSCSLKRSLHKQFQISFEILIQAFPNLVAQLKSLLDPIISFTLIFFLPIEEDESEKQSRGIEGKQFLFIVLRF